MAYKQLKKRILRQRAQREAVARTETRDAILWDVLSDKKCRIKILGSNTLLTANYPENWESTPVWLKPGQAVRVNHTSGNRNILTLVGFGTAIPDPVGGALLPVLGAGEDAVLSGLDIYPYQTPAMAVYITTGTYRVGGTNYTAGPITMAAGSALTMGSGAPIDATAAAVAIAAAHGSLPRLDLLVIGTDGVVDRVAGTAADPPIEPNVPSGHLRIGNVLVPPGVTAIKGEHVNRSYTPPEATQLVITAVSDTELAWGENTATITLAVRDQYGNNVNGHWGVKATINPGTGYIDDNATVSTATKYTTTNLGNPAATVTFTYTRNLAASPEKSVVLAFEMLSVAGFTTGQSLLLYDSGGNLL